MPHRSGSAPRSADWNGSRSNTRTATAPASSPAHTAAGPNTHPAVDANNSCPTRQQPRARKTRDALPQANRACSPASRTTDPAPGTHTPASPPPTRHNDRPHRVPPPDPPSSTPPPDAGPGCSNQPQKPCSGGVFISRAGQKPSVPVGHISGNHPTPPGFRDSLPRAGFSTRLLLAGQPFVIWPQRMTAHRGLRDSLLPLRSTTRRPLMKKSSRPRRWRRTAPLRRLSSSAAPTCPPLLANATASVRHLSLLSVARLVRSLLGRLLPGVAERRPS